jgi:hypothetical protein
MNLIGHDGLVCDVQRYHRFLDGGIENDLGSMC